MVKHVSCVVVGNVDERGAVSQVDPKTQSCATVVCLPAIDYQKVMHKPPMFLVDVMPVVEGVFGQVTRVLRDTGSNTTIVRPNLVPDRCLTGKTRNVMLLDGKRKELPEALQTPYFIGNVNALCMTNPLYDLVLGNIP
ncbi:hypothetical protein HPB50_004027 [Hyalomma asiaticum]|uniref:Uncharacterized protein n=1 Tax=Hyalomma asiaticum TaxID=266040 RepID=A0ACB7SUU7_HYAAI|nr:hypothetical protein HPB50_004027 [Hyalomma asiaticum]